MSGTPPAGRGPLSSGTGEPTAGHAPAAVHERAARWRSLRPLDRLRSIKTKLGVLVLVSVFCSTVVIVAGMHADVRFRYLVAATPPACLVVTVALAHGMTSPLREMTVAARAMARGDYSRRVRATSRDEVGHLATAFNRMAADLEAVDRHRRELVANVSHELRTPISALHALLENMVDGVQQPDPDTLARALEQTGRLGRLVTALLDLSRVESGGIPLARVEFAVRPFLESVLREARTPRCGVRIETDVQPESLCVFADPERLHQVVANLVHNACRHSPPGGRVRLYARPGVDGVSPAGSVGGGGALLLEVRDEGPGIPRKERQRVFERFTRGGDHSATDGGTGLGLAIARWLVELHGGEISVAESARGCRIRVELPGQARATTPATEGH